MEEWIRKSTRQCGRTNALIEIARRTGSHVLVQNLRHAEQLRKQHPDVKFESSLNANQHGMRNGVIIDHHIYEVAILKLLAKVEELEDHIKELKAS